MYTVGDIMSQVVCTIPDDKLVCEVEGVLVTEKISGAPIINLSGMVTGFISKSDIVHFDFIGGDSYTTPAQEICRINVVTIDSTDSVELAARTMFHNKAHRLMVVHDGKLVGMLSEMDIVKLVSEKGVGKLGH